MQQQEGNAGRFLERVSLADKNTAVFQEHLCRYQFALPFAENKIVLDAATGTGYGAALLANTANWVVGVDIEAEALTETFRYRDLTNLRFTQMDCVHLSFQEAVFDLIVAFEMIEHIAECREVLGEFCRTLRPGGQLVVSTPNRRPDSPVPPLNPNHVKEFSSEEFEALLQDFFSKVELFGQWRGEKALQVMHGTPLKQRLRKFDPFGLRNLLPVSLYHFLLRLIRAPVAEDLQTQDYEIRREKYETANYLLAICTKLE